MNRNNDSQKTINSVFNNFKQSKNISNNIINEQDESLIKETINKNENSILPENSGKYTTVKIEKNNTNTNTNINTNINTKSNSNYTNNNNIKNKNDNYTINSFPYISNCNCESSLKL